MPYLRFTRDARGYESTCLVHSARRHGKSRSRILYWFRTPPNVRVGRAPLDEEAIRAIEESNPDVTFDWTKILEAQPALAPPPDGRKPDRRARRREEPSGSPQAAASIEEARPSAGPQTAPVEPPADAADHRETANQDAENLPDAGVGGEVWNEPPAVSPDDGGAAGIVQGLVGAEGLARLRVRFAEIQARISERALEPAAADELRQRAELLNPDTWVTLDEARAGLDEYERRLDEVRRTLGPPRRRSRRGGRRRGRGGGGPPPSGPEPADAPRDPDPPDERPDFEG